MKKEIYSEIRSVIKERLTEVSDHTPLPISFPVYHYELNDWFLWL